MSNTKVLKKKQKNTMDKSEMYRRLGDSDRRNSQRQTRVYERQLLLSLKSYNSTQ